MPTEQECSTFFREYDLAIARASGSQQPPAAHQSSALSKLDAWYHSPTKGDRGGLLVLPTGGGKTFTAGRFLCRHPVSDGYKVLWLAHTHHLLEQAHFGLEKLVGLIAEPKKQLNVRVVSGTTGHFRVADVRPTDDVVIGSLQTVSKALAAEHRHVTQFVTSAADKLFVVFDEAHHSPAPSYRRLIDSLRKQCPRMYLLGLTATPTHTEVRKRGWFERLFPQGIVYQVDARTLIASGVLAEPVIEEAQTAFEPVFNDREYQQWVGTNRDLPEDVVTLLAENHERNDCIVGHYVQHRTRYGKTIVFADRWQQCVYLREALRKRGVRADAIYSHVDANPGSVEGRARRKESENAAVLQNFRDGKLDVLLNIRMATEGTDVPDVQTVFLTRQTTSQILLTQMVGRALRGREFGGTDKAYIVSFIDNWRQRINWAGYDRIGQGEADDRVPEYGKRPPLQLLSIDLVRRLARQMDSGVNVNPAPYRTFLPIGWYRVEYEARVAGSDDIEPVSRLVLVYEGEEKCFERFIASFRKGDRTAFEEPTVELADVRGLIDGWAETYFSEVGGRIGGGLTEDLFGLARHIAQDDGHSPTFFPFGVRDGHDLDAVARQFTSANLNRAAEDDALRTEYARRDRFWNAIYYTYSLFKSHYNGCVERLLDAARHGEDDASHRPTFKTPQAVTLTEPSEALKARVKERDGQKCLCCGNGMVPAKLQVDHISPAYHGGPNHLDNLQTLCGACNRAKGTSHINFRTHQTLLTAAPATFSVPQTPSGDDAKSPERWGMFLRRAINLFYQCAAVATVTVGARGEGLRKWSVTLLPGNDPKWLRTHLKELAERICAAREKAGFTPAPDRITVA